MRETPNAEGKEDMVIDSRLTSSLHASVFLEAEVAITDV